MTEHLFQTVELGAIHLSNRIVMAPMTRSRARIDGCPTRDMEDYYRQRSGAGLIITEGTQPSPDGQGYCRTPGLYTDEQQEAWTSITSQVRLNDGQMVMQLMHAGRIASLHNKLPGSRTVAPSPIRADQKIFTDKSGLVQCDLPEEMSLSDIDRAIADYASTAIRAIRSGMAGIELHATSGYLPAQFLSTGTNHRRDGYGSSLHARLRFPVEVLEALINAIGADRVGLRICPGNPFNDLKDDDPETTFKALLDAISPMKLAYLHVIRMPSTGIDNFSLARENFSGPLIFNDSFTAQEASRYIQEGLCSAVSFARPFIANPDFPERIRCGAPLAQFNAKLLYTSGPGGYSDYPSL